jgi:hypothetical protein
MPDMGWSDGVVQVTVAFRDASGTVSSASAGSRSKAMEVLPAPPYSPPDRSGYNRVGPFIEVLRFGTVESERTLSVFERADGGWSLTDASTESGAGSTVPLGGPTRESPHLFGVSVVGADFRNGPNVPGRVSGISVDPVATVRVQFENGGAALEVTPTPFPAETGLSWKAFAVEFAADAGPVAAVLAVDAEGRELSRYEPPRTVEVPPYVVEPLAPIAFSGTGDAVGGAFELPPPAFPATVALEIEHAGPAAVTVVCGAARIPVLSPDGSAAAPVTRLEGSTYHVTLSPRATACSFEVESAGAWEIRSP